jgi:pimeloyl-ACP methyl ester carboxylesterase
MANERNLSMTAGTRAYIASRHGQLHYRIAMPRSPAVAPPLLCLHQTPGNGRDWQPILADLADTRVVIAPDTPGYGMSDPPPAPASIPEFAAIMAQFMKDLAAAQIVTPGPFDVMGMHTGSIIATEMARAQPEQVRKAVLFGLAAYTAEVRSLKLTRLPDAFPPPGNDLSHVEKLWAKISTLSDPRMGAEDRHIGMAECLRLGVRMPWAYIAVYQYDFLAAMRDVGQEVLVINPQDDLWTVTRETSHLLRRGTRLDLPGVAHGVLTLERDKVVGAIKAFLTNRADG